MKVSHILPITFDIAVCLTKCLAHCEIDYGNRSLDISFRMKRTQHSLGPRSHLHLLFFARSRKFDVKDSNCRSIDLFEFRFCQGQFLTLFILDFDHFFPSRFYLRNDERDSDSVIAPWVRSRNCRQEINYHPRAVIPRSTDFIVRREFRAISVKGEEIHHRWSGTERIFVNLPLVDEGRSKEIALAVSEKSRTMSWKMRKDSKTKCSFCFSLRPQLQGVRESFGWASRFGQH